MTAPSQSSLDLAHELARRFGIHESSVYGVAEVIDKALAEPVRLLDTCLYGWWLERDCSTTEWEAKAAVIEARAFIAKHRCS